MHCLNEMQTLLVNQLMLLSCIHTIAQSLLMKKQQYTLFLYVHRCLIFKCIHENVHIYVLLC